MLLFQIFLTPPILYDCDHVFSHIIPYNILYNYNHILLYYPREKKGKKI